MKQKLLQVRKLRMRWRWLAALVVVFTITVPTALAMGNEWWGTGDGDFRDTPQRNNYIIHPPADQLPQSRPGGSSQDGARLSFVIHRPTASAGTSLAYLPNQYFVSSTTPNLKFEMRGGHWSENTAGGQDRYDRDTANVDGIVDLVKKHGFLSPVYYEVYQLSNGGQHDGRLLGIINPRDRNIFPTTDNQPNSNENCKYSNGANGPCWRTFEVNAPGQPAGAITNRITLNGGPQDSCAVRFGSGNPCFNTRRDNNKEHVHTQDHVWVVRQNNNQDHGHANGDTPHSHHNPGSDTGDTSQLNRNDNAHDQFNTHPEFYRQPGNCFWEWMSANDLNGNDSGSQHSHRVYCGQFENNVPVDYGGSHTHPDGSGITNATPSELFPGYYVLGADKLQYYNRSPGNYKDGGNCFWAWLGDFPAGDKNHTHSVYCYDRTQGDGGAMSAANFSQVDAGQRFNSSTYPNLNGNYVFLIKAVNYQDRFNGYVTDYTSIATGGDSKGCVNGSPGNVVRCPDTILQYARSRGIGGPLVQDGYYIRTPKDLAGGKEYLASAPARVAFNMNYGPVTGSAEPGEEHEYEEMAGQSYRGLRFQAGGAGCRNDGFSQRPGRDPILQGFPYFGVGNADWDARYFGAGGFEGPPPGNDDDIHAGIRRLGTSDDYGTLSSNPTNTKNVGLGSISGSWQDYPGYAITLDWPDPGVTGFGGGGGIFQPYWYKNEKFTGEVSISGWNDGNNISQGGAPFTWGYWPTCLKEDEGFTVTPHTPKSIGSTYKYNGRDNFNQMSNTGDAVVDFAFEYTLPETRGLVNYTLTVNRADSGAEVARVNQGEQNVGPGTHQRRHAIQTNSFSVNTDYTWRVCVNPGPLTKCSNPITFQVNKGPTAQVVSGDPDNNTNTGNVNYNCSKLAVVLTDPEGNSQVRPYFAISWNQDGRTNVVTSFNRSGNSDNWGRWTDRDGYKDSGSRFTSDDVRVATWTVNGSNRSVPNMTLTQFLQSSNVPEGADVTWAASGEDRFGASELPAFPDFFRSNSNPQATVDSGYPSPVSSQPTLNYRRFGAPVTTTFHKNSRPNLLPPGSTKQFKDLNGVAVENVTDGQTVQVETKIFNSGETPTKKYRIADYLGSVRDFEPPFEGNAQFPITVAYNGGVQQAIDPDISRVISDHQDGDRDQPENLASPDDDRRASYKIDLGENPGQSDVAVRENGDAYLNCEGDCFNDPQYSHDVYWRCGGQETGIAGNLTSCAGATARADYRMGVPAGTYDLTLEYFNGPGIGADADLSPPPGYRYRVRIEYPGGSRTVDLPIESNIQSHQLRTFAVRGLNINSANPTIRVTWENNYYRPGAYDSNFGLNYLQLTTSHEASSLAIAGEDFASCTPAGQGAYCQTNDSRYRDATFSFSGLHTNPDNPEARMNYDVSSLSAGTYDLTLKYYNARGDDDHHPPDDYSYQVRVSYPGGSRIVNLPIEGNAQSKNLHSVTVPNITVNGANPRVSVAWLNDKFCGYDGGCNSSRDYDANFGLESLHFAQETPTTDSILRPGQLNPGESVTLRYYTRANRNRTTTSDSDPNSDFQRRYQVGSESGPQAPQPDPKGGTVDIGDAHTFVPYSEDYCDRSNPLINHTCEFSPGDVLAPWFRGQRGSIGTNQSAYGYDPLAGEDNATFLVQANGTLSHFSGGTDSIGGYQAAATVCAPAGKVDWRKEMYGNIQQLLRKPYNSNAETRAMLSGSSLKRLDQGARPNVWLADGNLTINGDKRFRGVGTIIVRGNLNIDGNLRYDTDNNQVDSLGLIVLGNVTVDKSVSNLVGTYYVSDIDRDLSGSTTGCPDTTSASGVFSSGVSGTQLKVQGVLVARQFQLRRYFLDPSDTVADPAEDIYYDGRVVANTPPGFSIFRNTAAWYEIAP